MNFTPAQALPKIKQFCAYQERCHSEVRDKLYNYGLSKTDVEEIIGKLIDSNFLNEERFAIQFAGGRFRIKHWGKVKIKYELKQKQVSEYCIRKALAQIDQNDYMKSMARLAETKLKSLKGEKNIFKKKQHLHQYLKAKGYESDLINDLSNDLLK